MRLSLFALMSMAWLACSETPIAPVAPSAVEESWCSPAADAIAGDWTRTYLLRGHTFKESLSATWAAPCEYSYQFSATLLDSAHGGSQTVYRSAGGILVTEVDIVGPITYLTVESTRSFSQSYDHMTGEPGSVDRSFAILKQTEAVLWEGTLVLWDKQYSRAE